MPFSSFDEAIAAIQNLASDGSDLRAQLMDIVHQLPVEARNINSGATTILYSGYLDNGQHISSVI